MINRVLCVSDTLMIAIKNMLALLCCFEAEYFFQHPTDGIQPCNWDRSVDKILEVMCWNNPTILSRVRKQLEWEKFSALCTDFTIECKPNPARENKLHLYFNFAKTASKCKTEIFKYNKSVLADFKKLGEEELELYQLDHICFEKISDSACNMSECCNLMHHEKFAEHLNMSYARYAPLSIFSLNEIRYYSYY